MATTRIHQFHSGSAVGDAVTNGMLLIRDALRARGIESDIYVEGRDPRLADELLLVGQLKVQPDDLLLIHHSMGHDIIDYITNIECKKVLVYHNITPPKYFTGSKGWQGYSVKGYQQISALRDVVVASIAHSDYSADELRRRDFDNVETIPLLRDFKAVRQQDFKQRHQHFDKPAYHLLFVGRIAGNKGQLELVEFLAAYADSFDYPLHLTLIGHSSHDSTGYGAQIRHAIEAYGLEDRVTITGHVSDEDLYGYYRAADAYVSMSQHEGFGVPLVEAMAFDLPIVAYDTAAISSTLGGSGVRVPDTRPDTIAKAIAPVLMSRKARLDVVRGQRERLEAFDIPTMIDKLLVFLSPFLPEGATPASTAKTKTPRVLKDVSREYVVEGPCETSYSLAMVNRSLAIALAAAEGVGVVCMPMEGQGDYVYDDEQAAAFPELERLVTRRATTPGASVVTIRNTYPPRPAGMLGDFRLINFFWEETEVPRSTIDLMERHLDGLVVASAFGRAILRNSGLSLPIGIIGCGIDHHHIPPKLADRSSADGRPFRFLHVSSGLARKGIEELFGAYAAAFSAADNVELVIKTYDNETNVVRSYYDLIIGHRPNAPVVHVITGSMLDADMQDLYAAADAVVLPTRGEGFNLPAAEAMIAGAPVIVTGFSAQMDFCNADNAWLIDFDFKPSESHVRTANSNWAKAKVAHLAGLMRKLYSAEPGVAAERDNKRKAAFKSASSLTWARSALKTQAFVDSLMTEAPSKPKLKVAWISTWNTKCGIASYSEFLVPNLLPEATEVTIFASRNEPNSPDADNVLRAWDQAGNNDDILDMAEQIAKDGYDAVVFQHNFGFYSLKALATAVSYLASKGIDTHIVFHRTEVLVSNGQSISLADIAGALGSATRLIVHTVDDVNRLKSYGLVDNVVLIPHGLPVAPAFDSAMVKRFLGLREAAPLIASYGFLLPHKGISELILAFGQIRANYPDAKLLLLNGEYPAPVSAEEVRLCRKLISDLGLESDVILITDYLDNEDATLMLHAADAIVYPYQYTEESASGAVRFGLAALRPVAVTPLPIFKDVAEYCYALPGTSATDIAIGLMRLIEDTDTHEKLIARQKAWLDDSNWEQIGKRLTRMMVGLYNDTHLSQVVPQQREPQPSRTLPDKVGSLDVLTQLSDEPFVRLACQQILGRDPMDAEWAAIAEIRSGRLSRDAFLAGLVAEAEAVGKGDRLTRADVVSFNDIDAEDHEDFVKALYTRILRREGDEGGVAAHARRLSEGAATRDQVISDFLDSDELLDSDRVVTVAGHRSSSNADAK